MCVGASGLVAPRGFWPARPPGCYPYAVLAMEWHVICRLWFGLLSWCSALILYYYIILGVNGRFETRNDQQLYDLASCLMSMYTPHSLRMHIYVLESRRVSFFAFS